MAGMTATATIQPLDMIKTRMQLMSEVIGSKPSVPAVVKNLFINEGGLRGFYRGLGSALMRQMIYAALRLGMFYSVMDISKDKWGHTLNTGEKSIASLCTGAIAAFIANPFDLALIRFQADGTLPVDQRRNYRHWFDALTKIVGTEGFFTLWKGAFPTIVRAMCMNLGMLVPYEECKQRFKKRFGEGYATYISSSFVAGLFAAFLALPPDNMKTKIQKMKPGADGKLPYSGFFDCVGKTFRNEGLLRFWVGFPIFYMRVGIHAMITLLVSDALKYLILGKK
eukprot:TRINITY_DN1050_c0_g1_i3.p1 TRINITY_DN1050_c0_g1~~TRINITY_DN1050_c0_g1_i3.p1  ORF type:complete len:327 (+),score=78.37 TRINITY_DN1050_c0_g1_i3:141-983(+)